MPLSEANTDRIRTTVKLPFHLENQIGLDVGRMETMLQLGGIRSLRITSDADGETSQTSFSTVGLNSDGSAAAGKVETKMVPTYTSETDQSRFIGTKHARWLNTQVTFNVRELQQRLLGDDKDVRKPAPWAYEIDRGIRMGLD